MIGLFDSGSGGLSVLKALRTVAPSADISYFGDIANAPYGGKSAPELEELARAGIGVLKEMGATEIVAACNSVSPAVLEGAAGNMPVLEMSQPLARAMKKYAGKHILLLATPATIASGLYERAIGGMVRLDSLPIPALAGAIEFGASDAESSGIIRAALADRRGKAYDALILGCTHYPLVRGLIEAEAQKIFGGIAVIDPASAVALEVAARFDIEGQGRLAFRISKDSEPFRRRVAELFPNHAWEISVRRTQ